jgi:glycosyltransferase involved in cell wall biosynthesis
MKDLVDEIIVVDTGSTDKTIEIAQKYTDKIYHFTWIDDFSAARNFSFEKCTKEYIYWADGDDYMLPQDIEKFKKLDLSDKEIVICNYEYAQDEFGNSICTVPREKIIKRSLFVEGKVYWNEPIHEYLSINGTLFISDISIYHNKQHGTSERNLEILEKLVKKKDPASRNIYYLAKEYYDLYKHDLAIEYFTMFVNRPDAYWEDVYQAHYKLALCYFQKKDDANFKKHIFESLRIEDRWAEPFYMLGLFFMNHGYTERAIAWYKMCLNMKRPKELLTSYQPEYYTWLPNLNMALCYNNLGDLKSAYECNKKVLEYRPTDSRALNNDKILTEALGLKKSEAVVRTGLQDGKNKKLNIGCGNKKVPGYVNCDIFKGSIVDEVFPLDSVPYNDGTISAISSEHALEHVPYLQAEKALKEWFRVLMPGGELNLKIPEFEDCCRGYLGASPDDVTNRKWFKYTIYGIQISQAGEPDEAQIHKWGYSQREINELLESIGFIIDFSEKYDGWKTPSVGIRAVKPVAPLKIGWVCANNPIAAQSRIRVLNVDRWLRSRGYQSKVIDTYSDAFDVLIVGKTFDEFSLSSIRELKKKGKVIYCDCCESLFEFPYFKEIIGLCDKVICCSSKLAELTIQYNSNAMIIEDAWE